MSLTLDDLIKPCPDCGGTGKRPERIGNSRGGSYGMRHTSVPLGVDQEGCPRCWGTGRTELTEAGEAVAKLISILQKKGRI